ncbi:MAG: tol-pal system protein YbgF [Arenicellales bacterium]
MSFETSFVRPRRAISLAVSAIVLGAGLSACGSTNVRVPVQNAQPVPAPVAAATVPTPQAIVQLNKMNALQAEIRELRNQLEEQQFEFENLKQRQQDLFQGLDQRLRVAENIQQGGSQGFNQSGGLNSGLAPLGAASNGAVANGAAANGLVVESQPILTDQNQITPSGNIYNSTEPAQTAAIATEDQQALYDLGFEHLKQSRYTDAVAQFTRLVNQHPNGGLADDASYWIGEANYVNRQYEAAIRAFRKVVAQYPGSDRVPEALLKVGYVQYDIGDYQAAKTTFNDVLRRYADHPVSISAKSRLQRIDRGIN